VETDKRRYLPGERVLLRIRHKNVGSATVGVSRDWSEPYASLYSVRVSYPDGKAVPLTLHGTEVFKGERFDGNGQVDDLLPGNELCHECDLTRLYDLSTAGKYVISASKNVAEIGPDVSGPLAESNKLEIEVVDR
jgi:hypothetical protein